MPSHVDLFSSALTTVLRGGFGVKSRAAQGKPTNLLKLYDIESCPYCRLVREALTELDLDAQIYPCPKKGERFRPELVERGGKAQFPYLVDPNTGVELYESLEIIRYLYRTYSERKLPLKWRLGGLQKLSSAVASGPRVYHGMRAKAGSAAFSKGNPGADSAAYSADNELLELYSFEASPYARLVRELLCELEIPYLLRSCGRSRPAEWLLPPLRERFGIVPKSELENRKALQRREGRVSIPFLYDPNTDTALFDSAAIMDYLQTRYGR